MSCCRLYPCFFEGITQHCHLPLCLSLFLCLPLVTFPLAFLNNSTASLWHSLLRRKWQLFLLSAGQALLAASLTAWLIVIHTCLLPDSCFLFLSPCFGISITLRLTASLKPISFATSVRACDSSPQTNCLSLEGAIFAFFCDAPNNFVFLCFSV